MQDWANDTDAPPTVPQMLGKIAEGIESAATALRDGQLVASKMGVGVYLVADNYLTSLHEIEGALRSIARNLELTREHGKAK